MPSNVVWFERLMYISVALGVVASSLDYANTKAIDLDFAVAYRIFSLLFYGAGLLFIWFAARRQKNWARLALLVLFTVEVMLVPVDYLWDLVDSLEPLIPKSTDVVIFSAVSFMLEIAGLYLVFTGNARDWFRKASSA